MDQDSDTTIGAINGKKWQVLFKALMATNAILIVPCLTWVGWVTKELLDIRYHSTDRFSGSMFIEVQDLLHRKNREVQWLDASEIREIQRNNAPYAR